MRRALPHRCRGIHGRRWRRARRFRPVPMPRDELFGSRAIGAPNGDFDTRKRAPFGTESGIRTVVERENRRGFGEAVPREHRPAERFEPARELWIEAGSAAANHLETSAERVVKRAKDPASGAQASEPANSSRKTRAARERVSLPICRGARPSNRRCSRAPRRDAARRAAPSGAHLSLPRQSPGPRFPRERRRSRRARERSSSPR